MSCYEINAPAVAGEIIDGEAIIVHLTRGVYFSAQGPGALIWAGVDQRLPLEKIAASLADRYGIALADGTGAVEDFVAELARHELIRPCAQPGDDFDSRDLLPRSEAYSTPRLEVYTDMRDILLLDPIHDVDAAGWPVVPGKSYA